MKLTRRSFLESSTAFALAGGCCSFNRESEKLDAWQSGELEIHFIHTGVSEQTFFIFPDGTTMLLDAGYVAKRKPTYDQLVPAQPSDKLRGGEWVSRYLQRITARREIDYVVVSHWHDDHVMGLPDVAHDFTFRQWFDHQFPHVGLHALDADPDSLRFAREFIPAARTRGMKVEPFQVGARNQIALLNDAAHRYAEFEILNLAANGVVLNKDGSTRDCATEYVQATKKDALEENMLSNALRIRYGAFTYYTGGDNEKKFVYPTGETVDWEACIGAACGPADVCKTNHHACPRAMQPSFLREVRAQVYLSSVWSPNQVSEANLPFMTSREIYASERTIYHGFLPLGKAEAFHDKPFMADLAPQRGHLIVKVPEGGKTFTVLTLSAADESMRITSRRKFTSRSTTI